MNMFYKRGKKIGPRFCQKCKRPAKYSGTQQKDGRQRDKVIYLCGYHSPLRDIDGKTKRGLEYL